MSDTHYGRRARHWRGYHQAFAHDGVAVSDITSAKAVVKSMGANGMVIDLDACEVDKRALESISSALIAGSTFAYTLGRLNTLKSTSTEKAFRSLRA
jgi:hypothetical protein